MLRPLVEELLVFVVVKLHHEVDLSHLAEALSDSGRSEFLLEDRVADTRHVSRFALSVALAEERGLGAYMCGAISVLFPSLFLFGLSLFSLSLSFVSRVNVSLYYL